MAEVIELSSDDDTYSTSSKRTATAAHIQTKDGKRAKQDALDDDYDESFLIYDGNDVEQEDSVTFPDYQQMVEMYKRRYWYAGPDAHRADGPHMEALDGAQINQMNRKATSIDTFVTENGDQYRLVTYELGGAGCCGYYVYAFAIKHIYKDERLFENILEYDSIVKRIEYLRHSKMVFRLREMLSKDEEFPKDVSGDIDPNLTLIDVLGEYIDNPLRFGQTAKERAAWRDTYTGYSTSAGSALSYKGLRQRTRDIKILIAIFGYVINSKSTMNSVTGTCCKNWLARFSSLIIAYIFNVTSVNIQARAQAGSAPVHRMLNYVVNECHGTEDLLEKLEHTKGMPRLYLQHAQQQTFMERNPPTIKYNSAGGVPTIEKSSANDIKGAFIMYYDGVHYQLGGFKRNQEGAKFIFKTARSITSILSLCNVTSYKDTEGNAIDRVGIANLEGLLERMRIPSDAVDRSRRVLEKIYDPDNSSWTKIAETHSMLPNTRADGYF